MLFLDSHKSKPYGLFVFTKIMAPFIILLPWSYKSSTISPSSTSGFMTWAANPAEASVSV